MKISTRACFVMVVIIFLGLCAQARDQLRAQANIPIFETLSSVKAYASTLEEFPELDNADWENPDFSTLHQTLVPGYLKSALHAIGIKKLPWNPKDFSKLVRAVTREREHVGLLGRFVRARHPELGARYLIFGDLHGAFHSLVRDLDALCSDGIIDEHFVISQPNVYFVFNGNVVSRAPYLLEALTLVLRFMFMNPDQVFYVRGQHEDRQMWLNYGLKNELMIRAHGADKEKVPFEKVLNKFFTTLPLALYLVDGSDEHSVDVVRISGYGRESKEIDEKKFVDALVTQQNIPIGAGASEQKKSERTVNVRAIIRGEQFYKIQYRVPDGLLMSGKEEGATGWTVLSSPVGAYRALFEFTYDAFVVLTVAGKNPDSWSLALYNQDVREMTGIKKIKVLNLISGFEVGDGQVAKKQEAVQAVRAVPVAAEEPKKAETTRAAEVEQQKPVGPVPDVREIRVGSTLDLTGIQGDFGRCIKEGMELGFAAINDAGGIQGKKIDLHVLDDVHLPDKAHENIKEMRERAGIDVFLSPIGVQPLAGYVDLIKAGDILLLFPTSGMGEFRLANQAYVVNFRASLSEELMVLLSYVIEQLNPKKIGLFYQRGLVDELVRQFVQTAVQDVVWLPLSYTEGTTDFSEQTKLLARENPDVVMFFSYPSLAINFIKQAGAGAMDGRRLLAVSSLQDDTFKAFLKERGLTCVLTSVVPDPVRSDLPIAQEFRKCAAQRAITPNAARLEGFINASLFGQLVQEAGPQAKLRQLIDAAEGWHHRNYKGLALDFDRTRRQLSHAVWLDTGDGLWREYTKIDEQIKMILLGTVGARSQRLLKMAEVHGAVESKKAPSTAVPEAGHDIQLGSVMDLSRNVKKYSIGIRSGNELAFDQINSTGGIDGRKIFFDVLDDQYMPEKTVQCIDSLLAMYKNGIIFNPIGTPTTSAYLDKIKAGGVAVIFPLTGASFLRNKELKNVINLRASYACEGRALAQYALDVLKAQRIAIFYQKDVGGTDGVLEVFKERGFTNFFEVPYDRQSVNFEKHIEQLNRQNPDVIILFSIPVATIELIRQMGTYVLAGKHLLGWSDLGTFGFQHDLKLRGLNIVTTNVVPDPLNSQLPIVREFRKMAAENGLQAGTDVLEGYLNAIVFGRILQGITGPVTKERVIEAAERLVNVDLGGLALHFDPQTRSLLSTVWLNTGDAEWTPIACGSESTKRAGPA